MHQKLIVIRDGARITQHIEKLPDGIIGNRYTLSKMVEFTRTDCLRVDVVARARRIVEERGVSGHDFVGEATALYEYARDQITYRRDPQGSEWLQDANFTSGAKAGDCEDKILWWATHAAALRHKPIFITLSQDGRTYTHVFGGEVFDGELMFFDPTPENFQAGQRAQFPGVRQFGFRIFD